MLKTIGTRPAYMPISERLMLGLVTVEWLAEIDFMEETPVYKIGGVTVDPTTIFGDTVPTSFLSFNPVMITANGYECEFDYLAAIGDLKALCLSGENAIIIEWQQRGTTSQRPIYITNLPDETAGLKVDCGGGISATVIVLAGNNGSIVAGPEDQFVKNDGAINKLAVAFNNTRSDGSINGNDDILRTPTAGDWDETLNAVFFAYGGNANVRRIHVFSSPASRGLAAFSAT